MNVGRYGVATMKRWSPKPKWAQTRGRHRVTLIKRCNTRPKWAQKRPIQTVERSRDNTVFKDSSLNLEQNMQDKVTKERWRKYWAIRRERIIQMKIIDVILDSFFCKVSDYIFCFCNNTNKHDEMRLILSTNKLDPCFTHFQQVLFVVVYYSKCNGYTTTHRLATDRENDTVWVNFILEHQNRMFECANLANMNKLRQSVVSPDP